MLSDFSEGEKKSEEASLCIAFNTLCLNLGIRMNENISLGSNRGGLRY